jgi:hypothetical protein
VGQVGNLLPIVNRPADQCANADQAEYHSAAGDHPAPHKIEKLSGIAQSACATTSGIPSREISAAGRLLE